MLSASARLLEAVRYSHRQHFRVELYDRLPTAPGATLLHSDLPIAGGSITVDRKSAARRQGQLSVAADLLDDATLALLNPYGAWVRVYAGVTFLDGTVEELLVGTLRVDDATRALRGQVDLTLTDAVVMVQELKLFQPTHRAYSETPLQFVTRLLAGVAGLPAPVNLVPPPAPTGPGGTWVVTIGTYDGRNPTEPIPPTTYDRERWDAIVDVLQGLDVYFDPAGVLTIAPPPSTADAPVWVAGTGGDGVVVDFSRRLLRDEMFNEVRVQCERADGTVVTGGTIDGDPASPTYYLGPFGRVPYFVTTQLTASMDAANALARSILATRVGLQRTVSLSLVPNPALDAGDAIIVVLDDGTVERHVIDRLTIPLQAGAAMTLDTSTSAPDPYLPHDTRRPVPRKPGEPNDPLADPNGDGVIASGTVSVPRWRTGEQQSIAATVEATKRPFGYPIAVAVELKTYDAAQAITEPDGLQYPPAPALWGTRTVAATVQDAIFPTSGSILHGSLSDAIFPSVALDEYVAQVSLVDLSTGRVLDRHTLAYEGAPPPTWSHVGAGSSPSLTMLPESDYIEVSVYRPHDRVLGTVALGEIEAVLVEHRADDPASGTLVTRAGGVTVTGDDDLRGEPFVVRVPRVGGLQYLRRLTIWDDSHTAPLYVADWDGPDDAVFPGTYDEQLVSEYPVADLAGEPLVGLFQSLGPNDPFSHQPDPAMPGQPTRAYALRAYVFNDPDTGEQTGYRIEELPPHCAAVTPLVQPWGTTWLADLRPALDWAQPPLVDGDQIAYAYPSHKGIPT